MRVRCLDCRVEWDNDLDSPRCNNGDHEFKLVSHSLERFDLDNKKWARRSKRVPTDGRTQMVIEEFPSVATLDWQNVLKVDEEGLPEGIFALLLRDIFKLDAAPAGRDGPRAELTYEQEVRAWRRATGQDYSERPFTEAFEVLIGEDSMAEVAMKTHIAKTKVYRLLRGQEIPTADDLRAIARAYDKDPSYFHEFRVKFVLAAVAAQLDTNHEMAATLYRRIVRAT